MKKISEYEATGPVMIGGLGQLNAGDRIPAKDVPESALEALVEAGVLVEPTGPKGEPGLAFAVVPTSLTEETEAAEPGPKEKAADKADAKEHPEPKAEKTEKGHHAEPKGGKEHPEPKHAAKK